MAGMYAVVRRLGAPRPHYEVWNGNNNHLLTGEPFDTEDAARQWAERRGLTIRETARSRQRGAERPCWLEENGWGEAGYMDDPKEQAEECAMLRERSVAGKSNDIPECPVHGPHPSEEVS